MLIIKLIHYSFSYRTGNGRYCAKDKDCSEEKECNSNNRCVTTTTYRSRRRCGTEVHIIAVKADEGEVRECERRLRWNTSYLHNKLNPRKMDDFEEVRVNDCKSRKSMKSMKNKMLNLERNRSTTNKDVRVIFAVVSKNDLSGDCEQALRKLPRQVEKDLRCREIRDMRDESVIRVNSESQCNKWRLRNKVRRAADLI